MNMTYEDILDSLEVRSGDIIFLHVSFSRLRPYVSDPIDLINRTLQRLGNTGTLCMPRYAWHVDPKSRPWKGYEIYLECLPIMDLRTTPANIGVVPDHFWRIDGVEVSTSHFWPIAAIGPEARNLVSDQQKIKHAYSDDSCFGRLTDWNARLVGLGVTLNTTSLSPVVDYRIGHSIFTDPIPGRVIDSEGIEHRLSTHTLQAKAVRDIKPSYVLQEYLHPGEDFPFCDLYGSYFFSYKAQLYMETAIKVLNDVRNVDGQLVPWMDCP
jgi:hypothetical protein